MKIGNPENLIWGNAATSRRNFLKAMATLAGGFGLAACGVKDVAAPGVGVGDPGEGEGGESADAWLRKCEVGGLNDVEQVMEAMREAMGQDANEEILRQAIPFAVAIPMGEQGLLRVQKMVAFPPMIVNDGSEGDKKTQDQLWVQGSDGKMRRLGWTRKQYNFVVEGDDTKVGQEGVAWIEVEEALGIFDDGEVSAEAAVGKNVVLMAGSNWMIFRPSVDLQKQVGEEWNDNSACLPFVWDPEVVVTPTPASANQQEKTFGDVSAIAYRSAKEVKVDSRDLEAWQEVGQNGEILTRKVDTILWLGTPQEQRFAVNPETAGKLHDGLFTFAAMINWHGNEAIRKQYKTFIAYQNYLKENPAQAEWIIAESNYRAGDLNSRNEGKFVSVDGGVDLNQIAVAVEDADADPEGEGWMHFGGGVIFKMRMIEVEGKNVLQFAFSNKLEQSDAAGHLGLSAKYSMKENVMTLVQAVNLALNRSAKMATRETLKTVGINDDETWFLDFGFDAITKSLLDGMAKGTPYIIVEE